MDNWISVEDRLPKNDGWYIGFWNGGMEVVEFLRTKGFSLQFSGRRVSLKVTHWQPLPDPPKAEG